MPKCSARVPAFILVFFVLTPLLFPQSKLSGSISGKVTDSVGNPLPGCTVTVQGPAMQGQMTFVTTEAGTYRFPSLPPGENYDLFYEMPGFKTVIRKNLKVHVGKITQLNMILEMSDIEEEIVIMGESPPIDVKTSKTAVSYSKSLIYNIPMSRDLYEILNAVPGAISEEVSYRRTSFIAGGTVKGNQYSLDGMIINDPMVMYPMTNINIDVYEEVEMGLFGHGADVSIADGGFINIITRSGGNRIHGGGTVEYYNSDMEMSLLSDEDLEVLGISNPTGFNSWRDFSLNLGGPIFKDNAWFFLNGRFFRWNRDFNHVVWDETIGSDARIYALEDAPHKELNLFGKLTLQLFSNMRLMASYNMVSITEDFYTNRIQSNRDITATTRWDGETGHTLSSQFNWVLNQDFFVDVRAGYIRRWFPLPNSSFAEPNAPQHYDRFWDIYKNNPRYEETYLRKRFNPSLTATLFRDNFLGSNHEIKFGGDYEWTRARWDWWRKNPNRLYYYDGDLYAYPTSTMPNRTRLYTFTCGSLPGSSVQSNQMMRIGAYLQDNITIADRLTLNLGLRFDTSRGRFPQQFKGSTADFYGILEFLAGTESPFSEYTLPAADTLSWTHFSPRLGISYDLTGDGRMSLKASWSRYHEYLMIQYFSLANPNYPDSASWYWTDSNLDQTPDLEDEFSLRYMPPNPFGFVLEDELDKGATAPYTDELSLGIERQLARDFSLGVTIVYKHKKNIFENVNDYGLGKELAWQGYTLESPFWDKFDFRDPGDDGQYGTSDDTISFLYGELEGAPDTHYWSTNVEGAYRKYTALNIILNKRMSSGWQLLASVVWSKAWGNIGGGSEATLGASEEFDTPNAFLFNRGRLDYDRPLNIKFQSTVLLPGDLVLSGYFNHLSGRPWQRTVTVYIPEELKWKYPGEPYTVPTEENGTRRTASQTTLDLRLEKTFRIHDTFSAGAYIDVINALGWSGFVLDANPGGFIDYSDPENPVFERFSTYGAVTETYGSRIIKLSLRFAF